MGDSNRLETWGNETNMNFNPIIYQNILASPYFKSLYDKKTYHEIVDEIYNEVYTLEPFVKGTTASTAFCLLFKLWTQRLTVKQLEGMIDHTDSPYIRGIGFLYLRYVCAPKQLWDWLGPYIDDEEEIDMTHGAKPTKSTIGKLCRHLLSDIKFYGTMLPRIPVPIAREIEKKIADYDRESKGRGGAKGSDDRRSSGRERSNSRDRYRRRDDSRGSKYEKDRRRSRSPYSRERSRHSSRDGSRHSSRDRHRDRRDRSASPRDEFDDYQKRSKQDDERRRDRYSDRSRDRSYDRSYRRRSRSRDYDRRR
ncbi:hypothetical protein INT44_007495 [Umbelopsis vinacea]|uniref:Pre-mRNA-splicing factor 38 n=1 Tax=Umbelopsis vinacea TaxID=44442 RepID=A0A8H7PMV2_9FUNG|nr:hypothetical protein INT44_007495 [Umbelopsis vinacea]KAI9284433.1 PRP38 family-domain-containing protein [Umbelopsis sp. AD052]